MSEESCFIKSMIVRVFCFVLERPRLLLLFMFFLGRGREIQGSSAAVRNTIFCVEIFLRSSFIGRLP